MIDDEEDYHDNNDDHNDIPRGRQPSHQRRQLTSGDVALITSLMASHARRGTVESAIMCERLLRRVVMEVDYIHSHLDRSSSNNNNNNNNSHYNKTQDIPRNESSDIQRVDDDDDDDDDVSNWDEEDEEVRVTTKMYTVCIDAWSKCQSRPFLPGGGGGGGTREGGSSDRNGNDAVEGNPYREQSSTASSLPPPSPQPTPSNNQRKHPQKLPLGAAAQRAHRIHNSLVQVYKQTGDVYLAPSTISFNAAINAWSKSYHPSAGEMAELLLGEMMHEWKFGTSIMTPQWRNGSQTTTVTTTEGRPRGNDRVKPDVVTFTAVIDAWVKCTALAAIHENHHHNAKTEASPSSPSSSLPNDSSLSSSLSSSSHRELQQPPVETTSSSSADEVTKKAAVRAKEILKLMISLGHYSEDKEDKCQPGMRPNCYTYSAVMNALAKSCSSASSTSRGGAMTSTTSGKGGKNKQPQQYYDPAREAQDMLEDMIIKYRRYKERVGDVPWKAKNRIGYNYEGASQFHDDWTLPHENESEGGEDTAEGSESSRYSSKERLAMMTDVQTSEVSSLKNDPNWYEPRPDEITFPPNTVNYNAVLNAWSRASRYDPYAAVRAENILLKRMEALPSSAQQRQVGDNQGDFDDSQTGLDSDDIIVGGDNVEPDALSYSLVIHAWLRGCRGVSSSSSQSGNRSTNNPQRDSLRNVMAFSNLDRIERAIAILDRLEAWAHRTRVQPPKWRRERESGAYNSDHDDNGRQGATPTKLDFEDDVDADVSIDDNIFDSDDIQTDEDEGETKTASYNCGYQYPAARSSSPSSSESFRQHDKARDLDVEVYNAVLLALSRDQQSNIDHAARVMFLLDRMEKLANELNMPSVRPNLRSYNIALGVISHSAARVDTSLAGYYKNKSNIDDFATARFKAGGGGDYKEKSSLRNNSPQKFNPLYAGKAAESILGRMMARNYRPDAYTFASVLNTYQRIPDGKLDAALAADDVVRGMESLHFHGRILEPPDVFHYTMVCACWSRSGQRDMAGERCSEILRRMQQRDRDGYPRVRPNIRTFNAIIDSYAYNDRVAEAEDLLLSMIDNYESSAARSMDGIEDEELPIRPDIYSFNTVIQQWARSRSPEGGRRAEAILDRMIEFHHNGNSDVRPDERSFSSIIFHYTKGAGRMHPTAPDRALKLLRRMISMFRQGYKEIFPSFQNKTNPMYTFTSVIDAHSVLRRPNSGIIADELLQAMAGLGTKVDALRPNTYACLSVLYAWSSCGSIDAGERATKLLHRMERDMTEAAKSYGESRMRTTQRCYILAQTAWARSPSAGKAEGAMEVLEMMEKSFGSGNVDLKPTVQAYSMVCAFSGLRRCVHHFCQLGSLLTCTEFISGPQCMCIFRCISR